jgi:uncharacterized OB-fold protein
MTPGPPRYRGPAGRCAVCGSLTQPGDARCEIHRRSSARSALVLLALVAAVAAALYLAP